MSKIIWPSEEEKWMAIGYLASQGVIASIEATVPLGKTLEFQREFRGKYDSEYPYEANKFGRQFRIYLNDTEGCPAFLYNQLDTQYKNRINDTDFIKDLVLNYEFRFSKKPQPGWKIRNAVKAKGEDAYDAFEKGQKPGLLFIDTLIRRIKSGDSLSNPTIVTSSSVNGARKASNKRKRVIVDQTKELPPDYLLRLGWLGEAYLCRLLDDNNSLLYRELNILPETIKDVIWYNSGWIDEPHPMLWKDKSVGKGSDFVIITNQSEYYIEVKSSKRKYPFISMTGNEIKKMEAEGERYFLVKIDYLERLLSNESPEIHVFKSPYQYFFKADKIKEATFMTGN